MHSITHLIPKSMCSWMPKPKLPLWEKFSFLSSYSFTLKPLSRISSACSNKCQHDGYIFPDECAIYKYISWPFYV